MPLSGVNSRFLALLCKVVQCCVFACCDLIWVIVARAKSEKRLADVGTLSVATPGGEKYQLPIFTLFCPLCPAFSFAPIIAQLRLMVCIYGIYTCDIV